MTTTLAIPIIFPSIDPSEPMVDLFAPEDASLTFLEKRPYVGDSNTVRIQVGRIEEQEFKLVRLCSMQGEEMH